jgi:16S rRNA processing protein RimM
MVAKEKQPGWVCVGAVATAHGVRGALKLRCFTERPEDIAAYGPVYNDRGEKLFDLRIIGDAKGGVIVRAAGIEDRDAAEALRGLELFVPREKLPEPAEDEFYLADLEGLDVVTTDGRPFGTVRQVQDYGAGDLVEIRTPDGRTEILPFDRRTFPEIDLAARRLVVEPPDEIVVEPAPEASLPDMDVQDTEEPA